MTKTNHTTSATNSDCEATSPSVPETAPSARGAMNRRQVMTAMTAIAATPAFPAPALASAIRAPDRRPWDTAMAKWQRAKHHLEKTTIPEWERASSAYAAACDSIPHQSFTFKGANYTSTLTTANKNDVALARRVLPRLERIASERPSPELDIYRQIIAADEARQAARKRIAERTGYAAACDRENVAEEALSDAESALLRMPAPDCEALMWKLEFLYGEEARDSDDYAPAWALPIVDACLADARRLLSTGRA